MFIELLDLECDDRFVQCFTACRDELADRTDAQLN